jgi:malonate decarboxylase delta subunit
MEKLIYSFPGTGQKTRRRPVALVGVVSSGNLEVLVEEADLDGSCRIVVNTSANGFGKIWEALLTDFSARHDLANLQFSINDAGATPAVVSLRLDQALEEFLGGQP